MGYCNKLNAESDKRMQLCSIKPDIKKICENVRHFASLLTKLFVFFKYSYFSLKMSFMLTYNEFVVIFK